MYITHFSMPHINIGLGPFSSPIFFWNIGFKFGYVVEKKSQHQTWSCLYLCLQVINLFFLCSWGSLFVLIFISASELCSFFLDIYIQVLCFVFNFTLSSCSLDSCIHLFFACIRLCMFMFHLYHHLHFHIIPPPILFCFFYFSSCSSSSLTWSHCCESNSFSFLLLGFLFSCGWSSSSLSSMTPSSEIQLGEPKTLAISTNERSGDEADVFFSINSSLETLLHRSHGAWRTCITRKVFHRDLKPRNVLVSSNSNHITVKIADFGLSQQAQLHDLDTRRFTNRRMFTGIVGTTPYKPNPLHAPKSSHQ